MNAASNIRLFQYVSLAGSAYLLHWQNAHEAAAVMLTKLERSASRFKKKS